MNSDQVRYFIEVAKCLNFSEAADNLNISQSSLSKQIQNLELEVGVPLFLRTTRKIALTQAGAEFFDHALILQEEYNRIFSAMRKHMPRGKRSIVLSSIPVMSIYRVTEMIAAFNETSPDVTIEITEEDTVYVIQHLRERKVDVALAVTNVPTGKDLHLFPVIDDDMVLIVNKNHRLANRECVALQEAAGENFIFLGVETAMYNICYEQCRAAGFEPRIINTRQTNMQIETIIDFVSKGLGVSIMMAGAADYYQNPNYRIIRLEETFQAHLAFMTRNEPLPPPCRLLLDFALRYYGRKKGAAGPAAEE